MFCGFVTKIAKGPKGWMGGCAGKATNVKKYLDWINSGPDLNKLPDLGEESEAYLIKDIDEVYYVEQGGLIQLDNPIGYVLGSGGVFALGALAIGGSVELATKAAILCDTRCGGEIDILKLDGVE